MASVLVTIRLDDGEIEQHQIDYLPTLEAAYAANYGGRRVTVVDGHTTPRRRRPAVADANAPARGGDVKEA